MTRGNKSMEVDSPEGSNFQTPFSNKRLLVARPVAAGSSGKGLPYAPEHWPCPGDTWRWKVGVRKTASGYWADRYLYPPVHFPRAPGKKLGLPSRLSVEEYIRKEFPDMSIDAFFASFIWRVPSADCAPGKDDSSHNGNEIKMLGALDITGNRMAKDLRNAVELSQTNDIVNGRAQLPVCMTSNHGSLSMKLEDDIDKILQEFKESQELLYRAVEQKLYSQKDYLLSLYQQLDPERSALANPMPLPNGGDYDNLLANVLERVDQIKHEEEKLGNMMKIAKGFGQMHKTFVGGHFGLAIDDRTKSDGCMAASNCLR